MQPGGPYQPVPVPDGSIRGGGSVRAAGAATPLAPGAVASRTGAGGCGAKLLTWALALGISAAGADQIEGLPFRRRPASTASQHSTTVDGTIKGAQQRASALPVRPRRNSSFSVAALRTPHPPDRRLQILGRAEYIAPGGTSWEHDLGAAVMPGDGPESRSLASLGAGQCRVATWNGWKQRQHRRPQAQVGCSHNPSPAPLTGATAGAAFYIHPFIHPPPTQPSVNTKLGALVVGGLVGCGGLQQAASRVFCWSRAAAGAARIQQSSGSGG
ncbi:hypothetical protein Purlil1_6013 [Purpureocillium lilacinum]|uniref:Uncharacterized protein n=1 Tax=Purpureocillium lilacinum TaxID=33203 RepID=A0ABR0BZB8_PURLI|nr:hypothetical protein Purlil1_6013 [Purpureocillium lilacinum]